MSPDRSLEAQPPGPLRRRWRWPAVVLGMLGLHASIWLTFTLVAVRDPGFAIEPDYYKKALDWDATAALERASKALGWSAELRAGAGPGALGTRRVLFRLTDPAGRPVEGAEVDAVAFAHARANERLALRLSEEKPGLYAVSSPMRRAGVWEFRVTARRGPAIFLHSEHLELEQGPPP